MAQRKLPDHRPKVRTCGDYYFPEERAVEIAKRFGFRDDFDLTSRLSWIFTLSDSEQPFPRGEQKKLLKAVRDDTQRLLNGFESLEESLVKLGIEERRSIYDQAPGIDLDQIRDTVHKLGRVASQTLNPLGPAASAAYKVFPKEEGGAPPGKTFISLVCQLLIVYEEGTGKKPEPPAHDRAHETYGGDFFKFLEECLNVVGTDKSPQTLGRAVTRIFAKLNSFTCSVLKRHNKGLSWAWAG